jgi:uncharacterized Fe-S radical SAM superfamily protein PflX
VEQLPRLVTIVRTVEGPNPKMWNSVMWFSRVEMNA